MFQVFGGDIKVKEWLAQEEFSTEPEEADDPSLTLQETINVDYMEGESTYHFYNKFTLSQSGLRLRLW